MSHAQRAQQPYTTYTLTRRLPEGPGNMPHTVAANLLRGGGLPHLQALRLESTTLDGSAILLQLVPASTGATCPRCGKLSTPMHSRYQRTVAGLPVSGRSVVLTVQIRRFRCLASACPRRIFAERLPSLVAPFGRKTHGLRQALEQIGFATGGEAGARLAGQLGMATSPDTLLRFIRAAP